MRPRLCGALFPAFISAAGAIGMISLLRNGGGFGLVLAANAAIALVMFLTTVALTWLISTIENKAVATAPAE
jgi:hypothetical protein